MTGLEKLTQFMQSYCDDLFQKYGFKLISKDNAAMDSAYITLESSTFAIFLSRDRGQTFISFQSKIMKGKNAKLISIDLIKRLLLGEEVYQNIVNDKEDRFFEGEPQKRQKSYNRESDMQGKFLQENIKKILELFNEENIVSTIDTITILRKDKSAMKYLWETV